ncbi:MAG TPA: YncE family protein [Blastocatellia bacterium]|nr:YncE family protein [Blastocatellia bacterium]
MTNQSRFALVLGLATALTFLLFTSYLPNPSITVAAQDVSPTALTELSIDNASSDSASLACAFGLADSPQTPRGQVQFSWANKLTPSSYPATLRVVTIGLNRLGPTGQEVLPDQLYRIAIYVDPESDGPADGQTPAATFLARARGREKVLTFNLAVPLTITSGSFVIAVIDEFKIAGFPAVYDTPGKSSPPGSASYISQDGGQHWVSLIDVPFSGQGQCNRPGSFFIRATIETGAVDALNITTIKDPAAVEPWDVSIGNGFALVTNYVSDNLTVITPVNHTFTNVALGDGPGGNSDGPFGVVGPVSIGQGAAAAVKAYVTLFGSNTIPSKEFPIDYANVGQGRVVVLNQGPGNSFTPAVTINVGKGPRYPAIATAAGKTKLYVPCGGANRVDVIDTATNTKIAEIPVGLDPSSVTVGLGGAKLYVTNFGDGTISVIDPKTDHKLKDIPAPSAPVPQSFGMASVNVPLTNPWRGAIAASNGNLYVTYWGSAGNVFPNGAIVEFDTCNDQFLRAMLDDQTRGTAAGSAGASGIAAPTAPLVRDSATGTTPGAGGGGGGPFGIAASGTTNHPLIFTDDGAGVIGLLDTRIDQVVSVPLDGLKMCVRPRGVATGVDSTINLPMPPPPLSNRLAVVACGQPDNAVVLVSVPPEQAQSIAGFPVIDSVTIDDNVRLSGSGFEDGDRIEAFDPSTGTCLTFNKPKKIKKDGKIFLQRGRLSDGRAPSEINGVLIRFIHEDGTVILLVPGQ